MKKTAPAGSQSGGGVFLHGGSWSGVLRPQRPKFADEIDYGQQKGVGESGCHGNVVGLCVRRSENV